MSLDPDLAKKVLKVYSNSFKKMYNELSSLGLLGVFGPDIANGIRLMLKGTMGQMMHLKVCFMETTLTCSVAVL